jgi:hypothetical protein
MKPVLSRYKEWNFSGNKFRFCLILMERSVLISWKRLNLELENCVIKSLLFEFFWITIFRKNILYGLYIDSIFYLKAFKMFKNCTLSEFNYFLKCLRFRSGLNKKRKTKFIKKNQYFHNQLLKWCFSMIPSFNEIL